MSSAVRIKAAAVALAVVLSLATASGYAATYALSVSASSNRSGAIALEGPTLAGDQYIFTSLASALTNYAPPGIKKVCYWLDNVAMTGAATHCETGVPYDYAGSVSGSSNSAAKPWNTTQVANGTHSITQLVTLSAGGTETDTANFTVTVGNPAPSVQALGLNPSTVTGGQSSTATVTLTGAAPAGGAAVTVSSNSSTAQVPAGGTVTVPAGNTSTTFQVTTSAVNSVTQATISASYNGTQTAVLTINPAGGTATYALSVSTQSNRSGGIALNGATLSGNAYVFTSLASQLTNFNPTGITQVCFWLDNVSMSGAATHCESAVPYDYAGSVSTATANPWNTAAVSNGTHSITQLVTLSAGGSETDTATFTVTNGASLLQSLGLDPTSVAGGQSSTGTVTLGSAAPAGGAQISLSSSDSAAQVPASVTVPQGATSTTFPVSTSSVGASTPVTITASYNGVTRTATLTVTPQSGDIGPILQFVTVNPSTVTGGLSTTGTVTLLGAWDSPIAVALSSSDPAAQVPASVTVPANTSYAQFNIITTVVGSTTPVTISGNYNGTTTGSTLTLTAPPVTNSSYTLSVSIASDRSRGSLLQGATLMGSAFLFTSPAANPANFNPTGISSVCYWLDNTSMSGSATHCESAVPYDYAGSASTAEGNAWDTTTVPDGTHTITQRVTRSNNTTEDVTATFTVQNTYSAGPINAGHYEYVIVDRSIYVYNLDNNFQLVKRVNLPQVNGVRGVDTVPATHMLYISYGGNGGSNGTGSLLKYDLLTDTVVWTKNYTHGVDAFTITPNGTTVYMPDGAASTAGRWYLIDAQTGNELGSISTGLNGAHNTIASLDGAYVFGGAIHSSYLAKINTATNTDALNIGPMVGGVRPFTTNGKHTLAFTTASLPFGPGFQVSDTAGGSVLYTVTVPGFPEPTTVTGNTVNHGITLSPDEREIYLIDAPNAYVHVFDVSGLPSIAPVLVANIPLTTNFTIGNQSPCLYDCAREGWLRQSRDGRYAIVGSSGDVIDTTTRRVVGSIPQLINTRINLEIDWQGGVPVSTTTHYGLGYVTQ